MAKKPTFSLDNYKTHDGERGSPDKWRDAMRLALIDDPEAQAILDDPDATKDEIKKKLTKLGHRKINI